jgi:hypothetical protein
MPTQIFSHSNPSRRPCRVFVGLFAILLGACGGGTGSTQQGSSTQSSASSQAAASSSVQSTALPLVQYQINAAVYSNSEVTQAEKDLINAANADAVPGTTLASNISLMATTAAAPCKLMKLKTSISCWLPAAGVYVVGQLAIGPEVPGCTTIPVGSVSTGTSPPAGGLSCFQFVTSSAAPLTTQIALPSGITGIAELYVVAPNGSGMKISDDLSRSNPMSVSSAHGNMRLALMVRPETGAGGQEIKIGVGVPASPQINDTPETATIAAMNQTVSGTIPVPGASARYYFYPLQAGQTAAVVSSGTTGNQTASYRRAQKTGPNTYILESEVSLQAGAYDYPSDLPLNTVDTTSPYGIMIKISGSSGSAPVNEPFTFRVGIQNSFISTQTPWNNENLTNMYNVTSGLVQSFRYIGTTIVVKDEIGNVIPGERLGITITPNQNDSLSSRYQEVRTDNNGVFVLNYSLPACTGVDLGQQNIQLTVPGDHWIMNGQTGVVIAEVLDSTPPLRFTSRKRVETQFYQICSETYAGQW